MNDVWGKENIYLGLVAFEKLRVNDVWGKENIYLGLESFEAEGERCMGKGKYISRFGIL